MKAKCLLNFLVLLFLLGSIGISLSAQAQSVSLEDIVRNTDGSAMLMSQIVADEYCLMQGSRLPTIRELAVYAQSLGARGIRETAYPEQALTSPAVKAENEEMQNEGYTSRIDKVSRGQVVVDFYFSSTGYKTPPGELGQYSLWSATGALTPSEAFELSLVNGNINLYDRYHDPLVVRCVKTDPLFR